MIERSQYIVESRESIELTPRQREIILLVATGLKRHFT